MAEQDALQAGRELERMREFARHAGIEEDTAVLLYETQLERLREGARIDRYIGVRAEKHAREMLVRMKLARPSDSSIFSAPASRGS